MKLKLINYYFFVMTWPSFVSAKAICVVNTTRIIFARCWAWIYDSYGHLKVCSPIKWNMHLPNCDSNFDKVRKKRTCNAFWQALIRIYYKQYANVVCCCSALHLSHCWGSYVQSETNVFRRALLPRAPNQIGPITASCRPRDCVPDGWFKDQKSVFVFDIIGSCVQSPVDDRLIRRLWLAHDCVFG